MKLVLVSIFLTFCTNQRCPCFLSHSLWGLNFFYLFIYLFFDSEYIPIRQTSFILVVTVNAFNLLYSFHLYDNFGLLSYVVAFVWFLYLLGSMFCSLVGYCSKWRINDKSCHQMKLVLVTIFLDYLHKSDRGAHAFWLNKGTVESRPDHIINLIHYEVWTLFIYFY